MSKSNNKYLIVFVELYVLNAIFFNRYGFKSKFSILLIKWQASNVGVCDAIIKDV
jgi:hypothetical protein